ncbi:MAG: TRAFAC clade GTPase domain-containing protein [Eubacteriaceae bacterium]
MFGRGKKDLKNKEINRVYDIVCPFCFNKFPADDVLFRMEWSNENHVDSKKMVDSKLVNFWNEMTNMPVPVQPQVLVPKEFDEELRRRDNGVLVGLIDPFGKETTQRICPKCHNRLPSTAGKEESIIISFIGSTSAGKTFYMLFLIEQIIEKLSREDRFDLGFVELVSGFEELGRYQKELEEVRLNGMRATPPDFQIPLVYDLRLNKTNKNYTLCFYDFPGESITDNDFLHIKADHIKNASAHMLFIDPLTIDSVAEALENDKAKNTTKFKDLLAHLNQHYIGNEEGGMSSKPTAIIITKTDYFRRLDFFDENATIFKRCSGHDNKIDLNEIKKINKECQGFVENYATFGGDVRGLFKNYSYFGVSSLGMEIEAGNLHAIVEPCRVEEPLLWLLYELGVIESK